MRRARRSACGDARQRPQGAPRLRANHRSAVMLCGYDRLPALASRRCAHAQGTVVISTPGCWAVLAGGSGCYPRIVQDREQICPPSDPLIHWARAQWAATGPHAIGGAAVCSEYWSARPPGVRQRICTSTLPLLSGARVGARRSGTSPPDRGPRPVTVQVVRGGPCSNVSPRGEVATTTT
jgi:hypothetical protein